MTASFNLNVTGAGSVQAKIAAIAEGRQEFVNTAIIAATKIFASRAKAVVRSWKRSGSNSVSEETGWYLRGSGEDVVGRAGLIQFPEKDEPNPKPHGVFLEAGTKYITARHGISAALAAARPQALSVARFAIRKKVKQLTSMK